MRSSCVLATVRAKLLSSPGGLVSGAGWLPVLQQGDGAYGVETAPLDAVIKGELAEIWALRTQQQPDNHSGCSIHTMYAVPLQTHSAPPSILLTLYYVDSVLVVAFKQESTSSTVRV